MNMTATEIHVWTPLCVACNQRHTAAKQSTARPELCQQCFDRLGQSCPHGKPHNPCTCYDEEWRELARRAVR